MEQVLTEAEQLELGIKLPKDISVKIYCPRDIAEFYPQRPRNSHKGTYGSANIIAGSDRFLGAAALAVQAALKSGCGYVKLTTTEKVKMALAAKYPQTIFLEDSDLTSNAIAIGMGCGVSERLFNTVKYLLQNYNGTLVIDADGLNSLAKYGVDILKNKCCRVILTPHAKEFSRLSGLTLEEVLSDPVTAAMRFASCYGVTVLLKGAASVVTDGARTALNIRGNTALSKGGSGDMLSGYLCGTLARGIAPFEATVCSAFTLGMAAEIAAGQKTEYCTTSEDIVKSLHLAVKRLTSQI